MKLSHVGLIARDPATLATFYAQFLGLEQVARVTTEETGEMVLLSGRPQEQPQELALLSNPQARHVAFEVETLAELRQLYTVAPNNGARILFSFDHGSTLSFYFLDPEGNGCEVCWVTGRRPNTSNRPVDLTRPEAELLQQLGA
jgi:catechol-2,3-dioxygenase